jgi:phosphonoacetaldehyde hydrolase
MKFKYLRAVILDWAGTAVDHGSRAPVSALQRVFEENGVPITREEARREMGVLKKDQIRFILAGDRVSAEWSLRYGHPPSGQDVERLFTEFLPRQASILEQYSEPIEGVCEIVAAWRTGGLRIGSTTGYTRELLDSVMKTAARHGYAPDASVTPEQAGGGRPAPYMCYRNAIELQVYPLSACVKIGDTPSDIAEGLNAGMWTIGITRTGNEVGLSKQELDALSADEQQALEHRAATRLRAAGAHFIAPSLAQSDVYIQEIEGRLAAGHGPSILS